MEAVGDLPLTRGCRGLFSVSRGTVSCLRSRLRVTLQCDGEDVGSAGSSTTPRPYGSLEHGH